MVGQDYYKASIIIPMNYLYCVTCKAEYPPDTVRWRCACGGLLDIHIDAAFSRDEIRLKPPSLWRYWQAIPVERDENIVTQGEGFTPLTVFALGGQEFLVKQDHLFPSGSYKDRGASVLVSKVKELGIREVVEDSSGNAGCAIAAWCARAGIKCKIYVPANTSSGKTAQIVMYGAELVLVPGSREDTARAVMQAAQIEYYASHSWNPYFLHGTKTWAFEVWEQLGWRAPDTVILPAGNGTLLLGAYIGFQELLTSNEIEKMPKIVAVQSEACAPLAKAFFENLDQVPEIKKGDTIAEGIAIAEPVRGMQIVQAVRATGGTFILVNDHEIEDSFVEITHQGAYIEPTSAATTAAAVKYGRQKRESELVVTVFTGHGLKSTEKIQKLMSPSSSD